MIHSFNILIFRKACAIQLENSVIITGGYTRSLKKNDFTLGTVQEYNLDGSETSGLKLPNLRKERMNHACGHYIHNGQTVFIVTGGRGANVGGERDRLVTTEIVTRGETQWRDAGKLPSPRNALQGATIDGNFLVTGE